MRDGARERERVSKTFTPRFGNYPLSDSLVPSTMSGKWERGIFRVSSSLILSSSSAVAVVPHCDLVFSFGNPYFEFFFMPYKILSLALPSFVSVERARKGQGCVGRGHPALIFSEGGRRRRRRRKKGPSLHSRTHCAKKMS